MGEICGDYKNIPANHWVAWYHHTILDDCLEMGRQFQTGCMTWNIIKIMNISRNGLICYVNFNRLSLPLYLPCYLKFSDNGRYSSSFRECNVLSSLPIISRKVECAGYSSDGKRLLIGLNGCLILWDVRGKRILRDYNLSTYINDEDYFQSVKFLQNDAYFVITTKCEAFLMELNSGNILRHTFGYYGYSDVSCPEHRAVAFSPDGLHFLIDDVQYCVTGKPERLQFREQLKNFKNCDFRGAKFFLPETKENLRNLDAITD